MGGQYVAFFSGAVLGVFLSQHLGLGNWAGAVPTTFLVLLGGWWFFKSVEESRAFQADAAGNATKRQSAMVRASIAPGVSFAELETAGEMTEGILNTHLHTSPDGKTHRFSIYAPVIPDDGVELGRMEPCVEQHSLNSKQESFG